MHRCVCLANAKAYHTLTTQKNHKLYSLVLQRHKLSYVPPVKRAISCSSKWAAAGHSELSRILSDLANEESTSELWLEPCGLGRHEASRIGDGHEFVD